MDEHLDHSQRKMTLFQKDLEFELLAVARDRITSNDPSHDFSHATRVLSIAKTIAKSEEADFDVVIPAAIFHDLIIYPKNDPKSQFAQEHSADEAVQVLKMISKFPSKKLDLVWNSINECSFSKNMKHSSLESQIIQDADGLEATGTIAIMRTFSSAGQMKTKFYHATDPFAIHRKPDPKEYALDLFYTRLLKVHERMYTKTAQKMSKERNKALVSFLNFFAIENGFDLFQK